MDYCAKVAPLLHKLEYAPNALHLPGGSGHTVLSIKRLLVLRRHHRPSPVPPTFPVNVNAIHA